MNIDQYQILVNKKLYFNKDSRVLLLQGPIGNFFDEFSKFISKKSGIVFKINFTIAEAFFYKQDNNFFFRDSIDNWPVYFLNFVKENNINRVYFLNDSRPYHSSIIDICMKNQIDFYVFEDGYFRPGYITLEPQGVNGNSFFRKFSSQHDSLDKINNCPKLCLELKGKLLSRVLFSLIYNFNFLFSKNYISYRPGNSLYWSKKYIFSFIIFAFNFIKDKVLLKKTLNSNDKILFIPLQVFDDTQIKYHSKYNDIYEFIDDIFYTLSLLIKSDYRIIFKQHPGDRGNINYNKYINELAKRNGLSKQIIFNYTTDANQLINFSDGIILINSTLGINALTLGKKVFTAGISTYDSVCTQDNLDIFINDILDESPMKNKKTDLDNFFVKLKKATQVKGSFYKSYD